MVRPRQKKELRMNNSLKLGFKLLLITSVTALALAFTNNMTKPIIEALLVDELL